MIWRREREGKGLHLEFQNEVTGASSLLMNNTLVLSGYFSLYAEALAGIKKHPRQRSVIKKDPICKAHSAEPGTQSC